MLRHVKLLTDFYRAVRDSKPCSNTWSEDFVDLWLATLQLAPFENQLVVRAAPYLCATCNASGTIPSTRTEMTFPGGARVRCDQCGERWLEHFGSQFYVSREAAAPA